MKQVIYLSSSEIESLLLIYISKCENDHLFGLSEFSDTIKALLHFNWNYLFSSSILECIFDSFCSVQIDKFMFQCQHGGDVTLQIRVG